MLGGTWFGMLGGTWFGMLGCWESGGGLIGGDRMEKGKVHGQLELTDLGAIKGMLEELGDVKVELGTFHGHVNFVMVIAENVPL